MCPIGPIFRQVIAIEGNPALHRFGQIMSLRSDMLPKPLIEELQQLQDKAAPVDAQSIREVIHQNIRQPWEAVFCSFDETPYAVVSAGRMFWFMRNTFSGS
jgi:ubiquinone biosynthesis protein